MNPGPQLSEEKQIVRIVVSVSNSTSLKGCLCPTLSEMVKIVKNSQHWKNCQKMSNCQIIKTVNNVKSPNCCHQLSELSKLSNISNFSKKFNILKHCQNVGQVMFLHHSDKMSQRSKVSRVAL